MPGKSSRREVAQRCDISVEAWVSDPSPPPTSRVILVLALGSMLAHLTEHGGLSHREGGSPSIWINPQTGRKEAIPRHNGLEKFLAQSICRNLSVPVPPGN